MKIELDFTNVPEVDRNELLVKFAREIDWIASGARDRYNYREQLLKDYKAWGKAFVNELKEAGINVHHFHTNYSSWEYSTGLPYVILYIKYTLPHNNSVKSKDDFSAILVNQRIMVDEKHFKSIEIRTVEEYKQALIDIQSPI